jgi:hypothetical protein
VASKNSETVPLRPVPKAALRNPMTSPATGEAPGDGLDTPISRPPMRRARRPSTEEAFQANWQDPHTWQAEPEPPQEPPADFVDQQMQSPGQDAVDALRADVIEAMRTQQQASEERQQMFQNQMQLQQQQMMVQMQLMLQQTLASASAATHVHASISSPPMHSQQVPVSRTPLSDGQTGRSLHDALVLVEDGSGFSPSRAHGTDPNDL